MFTSYDYGWLIKEIKRNISEKNIILDDFVFVVRKEEPVFTGYYPVRYWDKNRILGGEKIKVMELLKELESWNNPFGNYDEI